MARAHLTGKTIVITGASSGIGRASAVECARAGMRVIVSARRADRLDSLVEQITGEGGEAHAFPADVADPDACARLTEFAIDRCSAIDAVFANAGVTLGCTTHRTTEQQLREIFEINVFGTMNALRPAIPHMLERGAGHLLLCSSCLAFLAVPRHGAYTATKAAQHHLGRALRAELHGSGVRVSTVHPIGTRTELFDAARRRHGDADAFEPPAMFMQSPERVARAVVRCLRRPKPEVWTSHTARIAMALSNVTPRLTDMAVRRLNKPER